MTELWEGKSGKVLAVRQARENNHLQNNGKVQAEKQGQETSTYFTE